MEGKVTKAKSFCNYLDIKALKVGGEVIMFEQRCFVKSLKYVIQNHFKVCVLGMDSDYNGTRYYGVC